MMKFDCPHCGQQLVHQEEVAGREGWCRFCKCILVMPQPGQLAIRPTLTLQQQFAQLERMFRFAAGIVDEHRQLQAGLVDGDQSLAQEIRMRTEAERYAESLRSELARTQVAQEQLDIECKRLSEQLARNNSEHAACLSESQTRLAAAQNQLHSEEKRDGALLGRVLAIEEDINRAERVAKESFDDYAHDREVLERSLKSARSELEAAREAESALKERIEEADARESALYAELAEQKAATEDSRKQFDVECERLTSLYNAELSQRTDAEDRLTDALRSSEKIPSLERELAEAHASLASANARHDALSERFAVLEQSLDEAQHRHSDSHEGWEEQRQKLRDEVDHYRSVLQKVEHDLAAIDSKRQTNESKLKTKIDEKQLELLRETTARVRAERLHESVSRELADSKAALASAEEHLDLLRQSTDSLKSEIGSAFQAKAS